MSAQSVETVLRDLVAQVEPTPAQKAGAAGSHNYLRSALSTGQIGQRILGSYLSGSYARDTAIAPLDDVDIIFEIDPSKWVSELHMPWFWPAPTTVLQSFAGAIRYRYPDSGVHSQGRSVGLKLSHLDIDVVPAIRDRNTAGVIYIPDRNSGNWVKSAPKLHAAKATQLNAARGGLLKPLVKLMKLWNSNLPSAIPSTSFMIETLATRLFWFTNLPSLEQGALYFWDFIASRGGEPSLYRWNNSGEITFGLFGVTVPDAAGIGSNTAQGMNGADGNAFARKARIARDHLVGAQRARGPGTLEDAVYRAFRT